MGIFVIFIMVYSCLLVVDNLLRGNLPWHATQDWRS